MFWWPEYGRTSQNTANVAHNAIDFQDLFILKFDRK